MFIQRQILAAFLAGVSTCVVSAGCAPAGRSARGGSDTELSAEALEERRVKSAASSRPRYRHAVIPAGAYSHDELANAIASDPAVARHYGPLALGRVRAETITKPFQAFVSYRVGDQIYWTTRRVRIAAGETILTDGITRIRARCGNALSLFPMQPTWRGEPDPAELDQLAWEIPLALPVVPRVRAGDGIDLLTAIPSVLTATPSSIESHLTAMPSRSGIGGGRSSGRRVHVPGSLTPENPGSFTPTDPGSFAPGPSGSVTPGVPGSFMPGVPRSFTSPAPAIFTPGDHGVHGSERRKSVPEPGIAVLLAAAGVAALHRKMRRRRSPAGMLLDE